MPVPETYRQYQRMSDTLRQIGRSFARELPIATASLHLYFCEGRPLLDAYDPVGRIIATLRTERMSQPFREAIERLSRQESPDPVGIVSPI